MVNFLSQSLQALFLADAPSSNGAFLSLAKSSNETSGIFSSLTTAAWKLFSTTHGGVVRPPKIKKFRLVNLAF